MSYTLFPPEINSWMVYTGPGSGSLLAAATAWENLSAELTQMATSITQTATGLNTIWHGPSATAFTSAVTPYVTWMQGTALQAGQTGAQASQAAALFETVHAAVVPPPAILANRMAWLQLVLTNFFGQNTPAIMQLEALYEQMWAQDGAALDAYDAASQANNAALEQPQAPPKVANQASQPAGSKANPAEAISPEGSTPSTPGGTDTTPPYTGYDLQTVGGLMDTLGLSTAGMDQKLLDTSITQLSSPLMQAASYGAMPMRYLMMLTQFARMGQMGGALGSMAGATSAQGPTALMTQIGDFVNEKLQGAVGTLVGHFTSATNTISAKLGQAASMGSLKVPQAWAAAADGMVRAAPVLPQTVSAAPVSTMSATGGMPGGPFGNALMGALAGRGIGSVAAKAPKVVPRSPAGG